MCDCRRCSLVLAAGLFCTLGAGCSLQRTVVNWKVQELDPSFIVPGETTFFDVLRTLGPPTGKPSRRYLRYTASDRRTSTFQFKLLFLRLPFRWSDEQQVREIQVEFDAQGVVSAVYESEMSTVRPPLEGEEMRPAYHITAREAPAG